MADKNEIGKNDGNKTNLSNPSTSKKFIGAGYLPFKSAKNGSNNLKRGGNNTKKSIKAAKGSN